MSRSVFLMGDLHEFTPTVRPNTVHPLATVVVPVVSRTIWHSEKEQVSYISNSSVESKNNLLLYLLRC